MTNYDREMTQREENLEDGYAVFDGKPATEVDPALKKAAVARKTAKVLGGKALKGGSAKQKKWAEELRAKALIVLNPETADRVVSEPFFQTTSFWIDNRTKLKPVDFKEHFETPKILAFQKPLRDLLGTFEFKLGAAPAWGRYPQPEDNNVLADCKRLLASRSTDENLFSAMEDRVIARLNLI